MHLHNIYKLAIKIDLNLKGEKKKNESIYVADCIFNSNASTLLSWRTNILSIATFNFIVQSEKNNKKNFKSIEVITINRI